MMTLQSILLSCVANSLWQIPVIFAAGWVAAHAVRPIGPTAEHRVWVGTLLMQALLPAISTLSTDELRALIHLSGTGVNDAQPHVSIAMGPGIAFGNPHLPAWLFPALVFVYAGITAWFAARFLWRLDSIRRLRRNIAHVALPAEVANCWGRCVEAFGVEAAAIGSSSTIHGPVTIGLRRKLVLLPPDMLATLPEAELRTAIAHEFAHMRRNDFVKNLFYEMLTVPVRFHPVVALTFARLTESREMVCDQLAAGLADRRAYARSLLRLASQLVHGTPARTPHVIGIFDATTFERRVMRLTENPVRLSTPRRLMTATACTLLGVGICATTIAFGVHIDAFAAGNEPHQSNSNIPVRVGPEVMQNQLVHQVPPVYPPDAKKARIQGKVQLDAVIGKTGDVEQLKAIAGPDELQQSALDAVRQWKYKPFMVNGEPVEVQTTINVTYTLKR